MHPNDDGSRDHHAPLLAALDEWFGKSKGGYDFWKIGKLMAAADTASYFEKHMLTTPLFGSRVKLHNAIFPKREIPGLIMEFGVAGGRSINRLAKLFPADKVYGFDSFEGLPEAWRTDYQKSHFAQAVPKTLANVELVIGWFNETLPGFLGQHEADVSILHVDCDLYSSTKTIFGLLGDRIKPGTLIVFDEYFNYPGWREHEHKAFMEFIAGSGLGYEYLGAVRSNKQVAVRIIDRNA
ncbi:MAG: class I SAM-dependent methyltransferase [Luteimonas sp.]|nr:class I SAM-dependent methyltransferase [Luteimonas sp.]